MSDARQRMEADLAALGVTGFPLFAIRRARCGCLLGAVHRTKLAGYVVAGRRCGAMLDPREGLTRWKAWYVQSLEEPSNPETWGCNHGSGLLPIADLLARARDTKATGPFIIDE